MIWFHQSQLHSQFCNFLLYQPWGKLREACEARHQKAHHGVCRRPERSRLHVPRPGHRANVWHLQHSIEHWDEPQLTLADKWIVNKHNLG